MNALKPLLVSLSLAAFALPAHAAGDAKSSASGSGATKAPSFTSLDTNKDGSLARAEVAVNAELAAKFKDADKDSDGKLSRSEYDAMMGSGGSAAGATSTKKSK